MASPESHARPGRVRLRGPSGYTVDVIFPSDAMGITPSPPGLCIGKGCVMAWHWFSQLELAVVVLLIEQGPMSRTEIANRLEMSGDASLKYALSSLCDRDILKIRPEGYTVTVDNGNRDNLLAWVREERERTNREPNKNPTGT